MSVYSTPRWNMSDEEAFSGDDSSLYLTPPEVCSACGTPKCASDHQPDLNSDFVDANVELRKVSSIITPLFAELSFVERPNSLEETRNRTPKRNLFDVTPKAKTFKSSPLKCISNIVTPIEMKPCIIKSDDRLSKGKENQSCVSSNSYELDLIDDGGSNGQILRSSVNGSCIKSKSSILPWLGIRRKCKTELRPTGRRNTPKSKESYATSCEIDRINVPVNVPTTKYGAICQRKIAEEGDCSTNEKLSESSSQETKSIYSYDSRTSLLSKKETPIGRKEKRLWNYLNLCRNAIKKIHLSPVKRLMSRCRLKIPVKPFKSLFSKKREALVDNDESNKLSIVEPCQCSISVKRQEECLLQIIARLTSIEDQMKEMKFLLKNNTNIATNYVVPPPPLPPPPPPPPPPINFSAIEACKRKIDTTTPENEQLVKRPSRPAEMKTQFSITVEDIKSVKLRKTPSLMKSKGAIGTNSPSKSGRDTGVVRSVKFKPSKMRASNRKELSQLVAEILSPSKKSDQSGKENVVNGQSQKPNDKMIASSDFETTPVSTSNMNIKMRSIKRRDFLLESPTNKRFHSEFT